MKSVFRLAVGLLSLSATAIAVDWKSLPKPTGYVSDLAGVIDEQSKANLESYAARVQQATGAQLAFVTLQSLEGEPIEDVANDLFHSWGIGRRKEDDGAMVLLVVADRKSRLEVGGGLGAIVPDGMAGLLLDEMRPALRAEEYGEAMTAAAVRLGSAIAEAKHVSIQAPTVRKTVPRAPQDSIPWPYIFVGIFVLLMLLRRGGTGGGFPRGGGGGFFTGLLLGQILSSSRGWSGGGRDGGGFDGFDSGGGSGGFGGFGGGDSGGGGASSDW